MLHNTFVLNEFGAASLAWIGAIAVLIEILAVVIIVASIAFALGRFCLNSYIRREDGDHYHILKVSLGKALLLGLEFLVAADIIRTIALDATRDSVMVLGLMVLIRTFLSWALVVEIEGRWPWQPKKD